jgi:hypothetical protein
MSTHSYIGRLLEDGRVEYIYCHFDGYLEGVGDILLNCHNTEEAVKYLISFGDASSIYENTCPAEGVYHSFDKPAFGVSLYYHRDRKEHWVNVKPSFKDNELEFWSNRWPCVEYLYLFKNGKWYVSDMSGKVQELSKSLDLLK